MLKFIWDMWRDEMADAQAKVEADKAAKKFMAEAEKEADKQMFSWVDGECHKFKTTNDGILIDCPFTSQWLKEPCKQCPKRNIK